MIDGRNDETTIGWGPTARALAKGGTRCSPIPALNPCKSALLSVLISGKVFARAMSSWASAEPLRPLASFQRTEQLYQVHTQGFLIAVLPQCIPFNAPPDDRARGAAAVRIQPCRLQLPHKLLSFFRKILKHFMQADRRQFMHV